MILSKKAKCQGCQALWTGSDEKDRPTYTCSLEFKLGFKRVAGEAVQPTPKEKCYKPVTTKELKKAGELKSSKAE